MVNSVESYREIRKNMQTGDIVLMHGLGLESEIIESVESSPWSHVAMVVRTPGIESPLIWESTPLHFVFDIVLKTRKSGARIVSLDDRLGVGVSKKLYSGFAWRRLIVTRAGDMLGALKDYMEQVHSLPFPSDWELAMSYLKGKILDEGGHRDSVFCAELIAETYMKMGLLTTEHSPARYAPKDFSSEVELPLLQGVRLAEEIRFSLP